MNKERKGNGAVGSCRPVVLTILDGWGVSNESDGNAIAHASTPVWDAMLSRFPNTLIEGSGTYVGLPSGQMGNSEVGHLNMGTGRLVYQEFTRINRAIEDGDFFTNQVLCGAFDDAAANDKAVHLMGLLSDGGVHSHEEHIHAMAQLAVERGVKKLYMHAFLDGRDTPPKSALDFIARIDQCFASLGTGRIVSVIGRYYAMDRDKRWHRTQKAYELVVNGQSSFVAESASEAVTKAYLRGQTDEFVEATRVVVPGNGPVVMEDGDVIVNVNFRADRARQITRAFITPDFSEFDRTRVPEHLSYLSLTQYSEEFANPVAFIPVQIKNALGEVLSRHGLKQLRIAETEKYAHVTFFFNGGREEPFPGEDRILVSSPHVDTYDEKPEMSACELTDKLVAAIHEGGFDVIICNFANPDMVGHTGNFSAAVQAIETIDECLGRVAAALGEVGGELIVTADHGNAEKMVDPASREPHTAHTSNPVPFVYVGRSALMRECGSLADVVPSILYLMELEKPAEMSGESLVTLS